MKTSRDIKKLSVTHPVRLIIAWENIYMLTSDMNLNIKSATVGYNNKILVSDGKFSLGKNDKANALEPAVSTTNHHSWLITKTNYYSHTETDYQSYTETNYHSQR